MEAFYLLPLIPIVVGLLATRLNEKGARVNIPEFIILITLVSALGFGGGALSRDSQFSSKEFLNGKVASKNYSDEKCTHCTQVCASKDSKNNCTSYREECDHAADRHWYVKTDYSSKVPGSGVFDFIGSGSSGFIYGTSPPNEWLSINIGQPMTELHDYKSYLKPNGEADAFPMPTKIEKTYRKFVPPHATEFTYGVYHAHKVFALGYGNSLPPGFTYQAFDGVEGRWAVNPRLNAQIEALNAVFGPKKQANLLLYRVNADAIPDPLFADLAASVWRGGGKNDVVVWIGTKGDNITWVRIMLGATEMGNELFVVNLRDALLDQKVMNESTVLIAIDYWVKNQFNRKAMKDFEYRAAGVHPPVWMVILVHILAVIVSCVGAFIALATDIFGLDSRRSE